MATYETIEQRIKSALEQSRSPEPSPVERFKNLAEKWYPEWYKVEGYLKKLRFFDILEKMKIRLDFHRFKNQGVGGGFTKLDINGEGVDPRSEDYDQKVILINPLIFIRLTPEEIVHVFVHEGVHAGMFSDGQEVYDEAITDLGTKAILEKINISDTESGYRDLVSELSTFMGENISESSLQEYLSANTLERKILKIYEFGVVQPLINDVFKKGIHVLDYGNVQKIFNSKSVTIQRLFPRLMNAYFNPAADIHDESSVSIENLSIALFNKVLSILINRLKSDPRKFVVRIDLQKTEVPDLRYLEDPYLTKLVKSYKLSHIEG